MRVLMLTHRPPFPPNKGDKIRSHHILTYLAQRHEVHLACLVDDPADLQHLPAIRERVASLHHARIDGLFHRLARPLALLGDQPISVPAFYVARLQRDIDALLEQSQFDCILAYSSPMAEYVFRSRLADSERMPRLKLMDLIDADSAKWADYARDATGLKAWVYRREARVMAQYEGRISRAFDRLFIVTGQERLALPPQVDLAKVEALPNGIDFDYFTPRAPAAATPPHLVFTGVMDYWPNVEGVEWFVQDIWPTIRAAHPDARFDIVGSRPAARVQKLATEPGVTVTGFVPDVRDYVARARLCVAPLRIARGVQNKVLEAMAMQRATVCTPQALLGIPAVAGTHALVANDAASFAASVLQLLADPARADAMGVAARACVAQHHDWGRILARFDELIR